MKGIVINMKLKKGLILSEIDGKYIAVAADDAGKAFYGMMKMNKTAAFITEELQNDTTIEKLVAAMTEKYDVTGELAWQSVNETVETLRKVKLIEE